MLTTLDGPAAVIDTKARYLSKIAIFAPVRGSPSKDWYKVWYEKTRMVWLPDGEKNYDDTFSHFDRYGQNTRT